MWLSSEEMNGLCLFSPVSTQQQSVDVRNSHSFLSGDTSPFCPRPRRSLQISDNHDLGTVLSEELVLCFHVSTMRHTRRTRRVIFSGQVVRGYLEGGFYMVSKNCKET